MFDIFKLRPKEQTAASIREALGRAVEADTEQAGALRQATEERDALLLDGTPTSLKAAEATLAAAREPAERVSTIKRQLEQRLAEAIERETLAAVEAARIDLEAKRRTTAEWWLARRERLAAEFTEGMKLSAVEREATGEWENASRVAAQQYPHATFPHPAIHPNDPGAWHIDVATALRVDEPEGIATIGDPKPAGTWG